LIVLSLRPVPVSLPRRCFSLTDYESPLVAAILIVSPNQINAIAFSEGDTGFQFFRHKIGYLLIVWDIDCEIREAISALGSLDVVKPLIKALVITFDPKS
jgi:hypothetical protein